MSANKKSSDDWRYSHSDLPKPRNRLFYIYGCAGKLFCYLFFGVGAMVLALVVFSVERLLVHPKDRFQKVARRTTSYVFKFFIGMMRVMGLVRVKVDGKEALWNMKSKVVVANHPSMLDVVFMISLLPSADCIVRGNLANTVYAGVIRQLYIVNTIDYDEMTALCKKSLDSGNCLIIFPEGTRTPRHGVNSYKKGAARIARDTHRSAQPVYIGGSDKYGLGKNDPFISYSRSGPYVYDIHVLPQIDISDYDNLEPQIAAKRLTEKMREEISSAALEIDGREV